MPNRKLATPPETAAPIGFVITTPPKGRVFLRTLREIEKGEQERADRRTSLMEVPSSSLEASEIALHPASFLLQEGEESGNSAEIATWHAFVG
jgi:hypothetical protein